MTIVIFLGVLLGLMAIGMPIVFSLILTRVALMLPVIIIGGLRLGMFTPTEAAMVAAVYALLVGLFICGDLKLRDLLAIFISAA